MADDLGYADIGCFGNAEIHTPSPDRLTTGGLRFTDYHSYINMLAFRNVATIREKLK
jgi:arylsulfatase A-like enzyme